MSALRYEDFKNGGKRPKLRAGDEPDEVFEVILARARGQARADGFADGVTQTEARIERELEARLDAISLALEAVHAQHARSARKSAADAMAIVSLFLRTVSPRLAELNLLPEITAALDAAFLAASNETPIIEVAPDMRDRIAAALKSRAGKAEIAACPGLNATEARIRWNGGFDLIDTGGAIERALSVLDAHLANAAPKQNNIKEQDQ